MPSNSSHSSQAVALTSSRILDTVGVAPKKVWEGVYMASVVSTSDPLGQGRVTMYVPQVLGTAVSNWATPLGFGYVEIPPVNAMVHAFFAGGDVNQPIYMYVNTNNTSAAALSVGTGAAPQTATTTPAAATGTAPGMTVVPTASTQSVAATLITNPTAYGSSSIVATTATSPTSLSTLTITGPTNKTHTSDYVQQVFSSGDSSSNPAYENHVYVDSTNTSHTIATHGSGGFVINAGKITAVQPGTGTSSSNPPVAETWHNFTGTFTSGWTNESVRYKKNPDSTVSLGGFFLSPSSGTISGVTIFTMPSGYIPTGNRIMPISVYGTNSNYGGWCQVDTSGNFQLGGLGSLNSYDFFLDGIRYPID